METIIGDAERADARGHIIKAVERAVESAREVERAIQMAALWLSRLPGVSPDDRVNTLLQAVLGDPPPTANDEFTARAKVLYLRRKEKVRVAIRLFKAMAPVVAAGGRTLDHLWDEAAGCFVVPAVLLAGPNDTVWHTPEGNGMQPVPSDFRVRLDGDGLYTVTSVVKDGQTSYRGGSIKADIYRFIAVHLPKPLPNAVRRQRVALRRALRAVEQLDGAIAPENATDAMMLARSLARGMPTVQMQAGA
jgi:hypothetical protein